MYMVLTNYFILMSYDRDIVNLKLLKLRKSLVIMKVSDIKQLSLRVMN